MKTAVVGGGAAGFFLAVCLKEQMPRMQVTIFERNQRVLAKVAVSGGGRCNLTNSFAHVADLARVYPRGHRLLKRLFHEFDHVSAHKWFEAHGVDLVTQADDCVFPASQSSQTVIDCLTSTARRLGVRMETGRPIHSLDELGDFDFVALTTGGQPSMKGLQWLADIGHRVEPPVPSLFTFSVKGLDKLMGIVANQAAVHIPGTKFSACGPLLITHWGMSGPAILRLSSQAARLLAEADYRMPLTVNWTGENEAQTGERLLESTMRLAQRQLTTVSPLALPQRLWEHIVARAGVRRDVRWNEMNRKELHRLVNTLANDRYDIVGRAPFRDEFVTCGGISLRSIHPHSLESRVRPGLFFAGELLDIDGVTGGFNFQAVWTTAFCAAKAIASRAEQESI